ncbi:MAG TPA: mitochondrial fission ELM1 family protein [Acidocella sp.]|nr:mitochondrial fission ELM1 family protein [Acidocella sp.]HQU04049.1 mitochondrial fission ELM1 family protein [Acidocella sp.]
MEDARILCTDLAGLKAQAVGLAEAAGLQPDLRTLSIKKPWSGLSPGLWPFPLKAVEAEAIAAPLPRLIIGCGGAGARVAAALRRPGIKVVTIQHPRMALDKFDLVFAARHDGIKGTNVVVTRTALHRVTQARLNAEAAVWQPFFAAQPRPLVAVLLGGSNGRYRFDAAEAESLAAQLANLIQQDGAGMIITPSRRTGADVIAILRRILEPLGAWIWDGRGENPYFGMLAVADAIIVSADSVSMVSEAVATTKPVLLMRLPGKSSRIGAFMDMLKADGRVRDFTGRLEQWNCQPLDDTALAGATLRQLLEI